MNEIEQAIENLEYFIGGDCCDNQMDFLEEIELALAALREKQEREDGCEYCQSENGQGTDIWHGNQLSVGYGVYRAIKFCPMCGKSLEEVTNER